MVNRAIGHAAKDVACICYFMGLTIFMFGCVLVEHNPAVGAVQMLLGLFLACAGAVKGGMRV